MSKNLNTLINTQAIGILDSGVGGLSIAHCITEQLPHEKLIYVADSKYAPYGDISVTLIRQRVNKIADWLVAKNCKALTIACNTATVNTIDELRQRLTIPIIGVEPAIKPAAAKSQTKKIGVLTTHATAINKRFLSLVAQHKNGAQVFIQPCLGLVEMIERGQQNTLHCHQLLTKYLLPLKHQQVDTIVLGCTHYPFVSQQIAEIMGRDVTIIDTALPVTEQLKRQLVKHNLQTSLFHTPNHCFYSSCTKPALQQVFSKLWSSKLTLQEFP